jgi:hypothetical protein
MPTLRLVTRVLGLPRQRATPFVNAFWSVTLYGADSYQVPNSINRFAVSSWMPFKYNPDGSLDLYIQNEKPGADKEANWLPAPKASFNLTMRARPARESAAFKADKRSSSSASHGPGHALQRSETLLPRRTFRGLARS